ncbi:NADH-ubiquinone oxidoreductase chain 2 [Leucoagaricus sp. SymC.cos]|nr:NADH-ubiquinone oxidoreductase chain 2 [Leucoagaricus sp. SymC.cos]
MIFTSILILIVAKALPSINKNISSIYFTRISAIIFIYAGVLSLNTLYIQSIGSGIGIYSGLFQITQVSVLIESFLLIIGSFILISWPNINQYFNPIIANNAMVEKSQDYSLIVLFSSLGSCLLISCFDLISLYISIELQSFGLYVLSTLYKDSETSTKAGLKYFLLGGLSSCIILLGCGIIYSYTGLTNFESIYSIISTANSVSTIASSLPAQEFTSTAIQGLSLGLILIFIGFLFKIAAAPLHNWSPDVYDEVPTIVTIWLTIIPKIAILVLLLELQYYGFTIISESFNLTVPANAAENISNIMNVISSPLANNSSILNNLLLISSLLSLLIGTVVGLAQTRIKRLLAYSTISHIGFILLALAINSESSIDSLIFYIVQYTITNLNMFLIIIALSYITATTSAINKEIKDIRYIKELKGKFFSNPILSLSLAICLFSMAGIPPLIGFFSKQFVLYSAIQNGYYFISIIAILVSVISASYYIKVVKVIYEENSYEQEDTVSLKKSLVTNNYLSNVHSYLISVLTLSILLFILKPSLILNSTQLLSLSLFNW